jgi:hypothetical protein
VVRGRNHQTTGLNSLLLNLPCRFTGYRRRSATLRAQPITLLTHRSLSRSMPLRRKANAQRNRGSTAGP